MRKFRGAIALCISLCLAFLAAYSVYQRFDKHEKPKPADIVHTLPEKENTPIPPPSFADSVPPGMRAFTLRLDKVEGAPMELTGGDRVDVMAVHAVPLSGFSGDTRMSRIVLQNIEVLSAKMDDVPSKTRPVTLLASLEQCAILSAALQISQIRLLLRNPDDKGVKDAIPTGFSMEKGGFAMYEPRDFSIDKLLRPGMRAIRIQTDWRDGIFGYFKPGDRVDIVVSCPFSQTQKVSEDGDDGSLYLTDTHRNSKIWRQNVKILAVSSEFIKSQELGDEAVIGLEAEPEEDRYDETADTESTESEDGPKQFRGSIVVELSPRDAESLLSMFTVNSNAKLIWILSRNPDDHEKISTDGVRIENIVESRRLSREVDLLRGMHRQSQLYYQQDG